MSGSDKNLKPSSGRVRHDSSGRAVWEWAVESGRHAIDSTSRLLEKLELSSLTLMGDNQKNWDKKDSGPTPPAGDNARQAEHSVPTFGDPRETDRLAHPQKGFDPYNTRATGNRGAPRPFAAPRAVAAAKQSAKQPGFFARLIGKDK